MNREDLMKFVYWKNNEICKLKNKEKEDLIKFINKKVIEFVKK